MDFKNAFQKLKKLQSQMMQGRDLTEEEIQFAMKMLQSEKIALVQKAMTLLIEQDKPILKQVLNNLQHYNYPTQKIVCTFFASTEFGEGYTIMLDSLRETQDPQLITLIQNCLGLTHFFIFPLLIIYLMDADLIYQDKLSVIFKKIGFKKIEAYLAMMPHIPQEQFFRNLFGETAIDSVKKNTRKD